jgi:hypothetical protein
MRKRMPVAVQTLQTQHLVPAALAASMLALCAAGTAALGAGKVPEGQTILERKRPDFDPLGIRAGAFIILPSVGVSAVVDDNVLATESSADGDLIAVVHPVIEVRSHMNNHAIKLTADGSAGRYMTQSSEDYEDFRVLAEGRLDVLRTTRLFGRLGYERLHEDRSSPDEGDGRKPVIYTVATAGLAGEHVFNRLGLRLEGNVRQLDFDDATTVSGATVNHDDRDRNIYTAVFRAGYELAPEYEGFARVTYNIRDYDAAVDDLGIDRNSKGYEVALGAAADFSGVTFGEVFLGYLSQDYDDASLNTISGFTYGASVTWNASKLTTYKLLAKRWVKETTQTGASGVLATSIGASVDHELLRSLLFHAELTVARDDYEGLAREDDYVMAGLGARYMLGRHYALAADWRFAWRDSSVSGADYARNIFTVRLELQY